MRTPEIAAAPAPELALVWAKHSAQGALGLALAAFFLPGRKLAVVGLMAAAAGLAWARSPLPRLPPVATARPITVQGRLLHSKVHTDGRSWAVLDHLSGPTGIKLDSGSRLFSGTSELGFRTTQLARFPQPGQFLQVSGLWVPGPNGFHLERARWHALNRPTELSTSLKLRNWVRDRLQQTLTSDHAGLARALLLAERTQVPRPHLSAYRQLGLLHLLAISGMHFWFWSLALRRILPLRWQLARPVLLLLLATLADFGPAVVRALTAVFLRDFFAYHGKQISGRRLWTAALWAELTLLPVRASNLGLILSYLATAALILSFPPRSSPNWRRLLQPSTAAFLATMPTLHSYQGTVEPWSILWTPLLALLLPIRLLAAALALAPLGYHLAEQIFSLSSALELRFLRWAQSLPATPWVCPDLSTAALALGAATGLWGLTRAGPECSRWWYGVPILLALAVPATARVSLWCLPVGHGLNTALVGLQANLFFDAGSSDLSARGLVDRRLLPLLQKLNARSASAYLRSHLDRDHTNALGKLQHYLPGPNLLADPGQVIGLGQMAPWQVFLVGCPSAQEGTSNEGGHVLDIRSAQKRAVLLGDQYGYGLRRLCQILPPGPIDVLLLPHHGLTTDGLAELLDHLKPKVAWASCGFQDLPLPAAPLLRKRGIPLQTTLYGPLVLLPKDA
jgi:competence protein ComEC